MKKKVLRVVLAAVLIAAGVVIATASPAQASGCDAFFAPSVGRGTVQDNQGNWSYKAWTAHYFKDSDHSSPCVDIQVRNYLRSGCLVPSDGGTYMRVRLYLSGGNQSVGPLYWVPCGSSTYVILAYNHPDGTEFRVEADYPIAGDVWQYNEQTMD